MTHCKKGDPSKIKKLQESVDKQTDDHHKLQENVNCTARQQCEAALREAAETMNRP